MDDLLKKLLEDDENNKNNLVHIDAIILAVKQIPNNGPNNNQPVGLLLDWNDRIARRMRLVFPNLIFKPRWIWAKDTQEGWWAAEVPISDDDMTADDASRYISRPAEVPMPKVYITSKEQPVKVAEAPTGGIMAIEIKVKNGK